MRLPGVLDTLAIVALGGTVACGGPLDHCTDEDKAKLDPSLRILLAPDATSGTITTTGACTSPSCVAQDAGECSEWHAAMTGLVGSTCTVTLTLPTGNKVTVNVPGNEACDRPLGWVVRVSAAGGTYSSD